MEWVEYGKARVLINEKMKLFRPDWNFQLGGGGII